MANTAQARKRARQAETHRQHNAGRRSMMRTYIKRVLTAVEAGNKEDALAAYNEVVPVIDRSANNGLIHKNKAAHFKSRLNIRVKAL